MGMKERNDASNWSNGSNGTNGSNGSNGSANGTIGNGSATAKSHSIGIYQPPAARRGTHGNGNGVTDELKSPSREKTNESPTNQSLTENINPSEELLSSQRPRQRRPDRAVYVPRGRRSQTTPPTPTSPPSTNSPPAAQKDSQPSPPRTTNEQHASIQPAPVTDTHHQSDNNTDHQQIAHTDQRSNQQYLISVEGESVKHNCDHLTNQLPAALNDTDFLLDPLATTTIPATNNTNMSSHKLNHRNQCNINSNDAVPETRTSDKDYNEDKEFQRASKEINRSNRRIIKQTFNSDVLEITDPIIPSNPVKVSTKKTVKQSSKEGDEEEDDWESMFDENGECLDSKVIDEITSAVGKVTIEKPKSDYKMYKSPPVNLDAEEFPHVLEVSNFPTEFKTQDLLMLFAQYKESGFDIKWVDDTHALAVFSSSKIASDVLNMGHPFVRLKPLTQATNDSRAKAKKSALSLQPYRQRPETCAALARRLVTGALGVRLSTSREERENERRVLREAKERKLLAAKLRDEAWEN